MKKLVFIAALFVSANSFAATNMEIAIFAKKAISQGSCPNYSLLPSAAESGKKPVKVNLLENDIPKAIVFLVNESATMKAEILNDEESEKHMSDIGVRGQQEMIKVQIAPGYTAIVNLTSTMAICKFIDWRGNK